MIPADIQRQAFVVALIFATGFLLGSMVVAWVAQPAVLPGQDPPAWVGTAKLCIYGSAAVAGLAAVGFMWSDWRLRART